MATLSVASLVLLLATAGALAATGAISQPAGTAGCVSDTGSGPCADGHALFAPRDVAVSPDGKSVYVASFESGRFENGRLRPGNAVARLKRNTTTGAIRQPPGTAGCISKDGTGACADGHALNGPEAVAVSPDGKSVYVASFYSDAVARLKRNPTTGAIKQPVGVGGCISETGGGPCADGHGLESPWAVAVSPDGKSVYVGTEKSNTVVRLKRNRRTGAITQPAGAAGCISDTEYGAEPCAAGHALVGPRSLAVSPDGKSVYVASYPTAVARLKRNRRTGAIRQPAGIAGCISEPHWAEPCAAGHALDGPTGLAVSPDGKNVYVSFVNGVARLNRNTTTGAITQPAGTAGCISRDNALSGPCGDGHGLINPADVAVSSDGKNVYVTSSVCCPGGSVARINRNTSGAIRQPAGTAGCISDPPYGAEPCADGHALYAPRGVAVSPDGKSVYAASSYSNAVARFNRAP